MTFEDNDAIRNGAHIIGVDEAGRGCLSGPVYAAAVLASPPLCDTGIADSKLLSAKKRTAAALHIQKHAYYAIGSASPDEILHINIRNAAALAMKRAIELLCARLYLHVSVDTHLHVIIDGNHAPECNIHPYPSDIRTEIAGDRRFLSVAAASVIAKTARDAYMKTAAQSFSEYGWEHNAGYGTKEHLNALKHHGITPLHRLGFSPVKELYDTKFS